ncbi:MAG: sensor histidine kinase [Polyangia bacterium]
MLGAVLREHREEVLDFARENLRTRLPDHPEHETVDHLPAVIDDIIVSLNNGDDIGHDPHLSNVARRAAEHGRQRERLGIELADVANDYGMVCDAVAEIAKRHQLQVPAADWQALNRAIDFCIAGAISSYQDQNVTRARRETALHLGGVAHELRNSLAAVRAAFDAIKTGRVGAASRTSQVLDRHLGYLTEMVNDLVGQSRLNAGVPPAREALPLGSFVEDLVCSIPKRDDVKLETAIAADVKVCADPQLLSSALMNVVQNAIKFTRAGGCVVVRGSQNGDDVLIEVEDQCGGIPDDKIDTLFAPFVQQGANRTGLGLGLSLVVEAMKAHGGSVTARNIPGRGCAFTLSLPVPRS